MEGAGPSTSDTIGKGHKQVLTMQLRFRHLFLPIIFLILSALAADAQNFSKELSIPEGTIVSIVNRYGRVDVEAVPVEKDSTERKGEIAAASEKKEVTQKEISI